MQVTTEALTILNIGLDRDLVSEDRSTEAQTRQLFLAHNIPAKITHIVKVPHVTKTTKLDLDSTVTVYPCPVRHWLQYIPSAFRMGCRLLADKPFDLIQVQDPFLCGFPGALLSRRFRLPLIVGLYSDEIDNPQWLSEQVLNRFANRVGKWVMSQAAAARSDSMAVLERLSRYGFRNLVYVPFLITHASKLIERDEQAPSVRSQLLKGCAGPLLLCVSRLEKEKNIPLLLTAFKRALKHHPDIVLAIAGHGSLAAALQKETQGWDPNRVRWLGSISNSDMPGYYQASDLTLLSSDRESAARVLSESLLAGTPVLTTNTAGASEVIVDGITGRIVPVGDIDSYSNALIELCSSLQRLKEMGYRGRQSMSSRVTAKAVTDQMRNVYAKALTQF